MYAHYDPEADIAWFLFQQVEPGQMVSEQVDWGARDYDRRTGDLVGLEFAGASKQLPEQLLAALPQPQGEGIVVTRDDLVKRQPA